MNEFTTWVKKSDSLKIQRNQKALRFPGFIKKLLFVKKSDQCASFKPKAQECVEFPFASLLKLTCSCKLLGNISLGFYYGRREGLIGVCQTLSGHYFAQRLEFLTRSSPLSFINFQLIFLLSSAASIPPFNKII